MRVRYWSLLRFWNPLPFIGSWYLDWELEWTLTASLIAKTPRAKKTVGQWSPAPVVRQRRKSLTSESTAAPVTSVKAATPAQTPVKTPAVRSSEASASPKIKTPRGTRHERAEAAVAVGEKKTESGIPLPISVIFALVIGICITAFIFITQTKQWCAQYSYPPPGFGKPLFELHSTFDLVLRVFASPHGIWGC